MERLEKNEIDIMPDMAYSEERAEIYDFNNESVLINWGILYTQKDSAIQSIPDLQGKKVAVMNGSIHTVGAEGIFKLCERFDVDCTFIGVDDYTEVFRLLDTEEADAGVVNRLFGALHEHEFKVEKTNVVFEPVDLRFAFPKNSTLSWFLIERIDDDLRAMKKDPNSIYYRTLETHLSVPEETKVPEWAVPAFLGLLGLVALFFMLSMVLKWQVNARTAELRAANEKLEHDIIERKKAEEELRESEERYRELTDSITNIFFAMDEDLRYTYWNKASEELTGIQAKDAIGKSIYELFPEPEGKRATEEYLEVLRTHQPRQFVNEYQLKGKWYCFEISAYPSIHGISAFAKDITERKRMEDALRESESKYKTLVENIPQKVFLKDKNSVYISCNENYARDLKIKCNEIVGKTDYDFYPRELADKYRANEKRVIESDKEEELEEKYITDGREIWVNTIKTPVKDENRNVIGVLGIFWDITERKQVEEERELLIKDLEVKHAEMERFAYTISHELRTPLVTLQGYTGLLQRDFEQLEREKAVSDLRFIQNAVSTMARLLEDTLELSRTGRVMNPPEDVPFSALVRDALVQLTEQLKWSRIDVAVAENLSTVHVDRMRLVEVLVNLIENSIKFMGDQTRPRIEIGSRKEGEETVFFVKDNGIGIDKSQHEKIFQLFYKVDKKSKGSGAGLAIVKRIVEVHGGRIWIESEKGKGCTVCFTLPVA